MAARYDAIVVGGGHNGLVAAAYLARSGARTVVLEGRPKTGGAATTEAPWPHSYGLVGGNIFHGELSLEQLFHMRPAPGFADYRTPGPRPVLRQLGHARGRRSLPNPPLAGRPPGDPGPEGGPAPRSAPPDHPAAQTHQQ